MTLDFTIEQRDLSESLRASLSRISPGDNVWPALTDMGLAEIPFPEDVGGAGYSLKDTVVVSSEMGRALGAAPYFSSVVLAGQTLLHAASADARARYLPSIADGTTTAALIASYPFDSPSVTATIDDNGDLVLSGGQETVVDGMEAELLIVVANGPDGIELAAVTPDADGVVRTHRETLDFTRDLSRVDFSGTRAHRITGADAAAGLTIAQAKAVVVLAAEQTGAARRCLEMSVEYAKTRTQFGRPIGSFQAIKHRLVDMWVAIELAEAAVLDAAGADERSPGDFVLAASTARTLASRAATFAASESIQVHGGIGFTWEHPLHMYFRRAKTSELLLGATSVHTEAVAAALL